MRKKFGLLALAVAVIAAAGFLLYGAHRADVLDKAAQRQEHAAKGNTTDNPKANARNTTDMANQTGGETSTSVGNSTATKKVSVFIVDASQYQNTVEVRAYASGVVESGTCTFTFTKGGASLTKTTTASENVSVSSCATLDVPVTAFPSRGNWSVIVSYISNTSSGTSPPQTIVVK